MSSQKPHSLSVPEDKDSRLKYVEVPVVFKQKASFVDIHCKTSQKVCERLARSLAKAKPKTPDEFERVEFMKDFVLKTAANNEATIELLQYLKGLLEDILIDHKHFIEGAILRDKLKFQGDTLEKGWQYREELIEEIVKNKKDELRRNS